MKLGANYLRKEYVGNRHGEPVLGLSYSLRPQIERNKEAKT